MKKIDAEHNGRLHAMALKWLMDRANPERDGGLGVFADTRYCVELTRLLRRVERAAVRRERANPLRVPLSNSGARQGSTGGDVVIEPGIGTPERADKRERARAERGNS